MFGRARGDVRGLGLGIEGTSVYRECIACRNIRDVRCLGLGVERSAEGGLRRTSEELPVDWGRELRGWSLKDRDIIGAERKCMPNAQLNNLTKPLAYQLGESIIEICWRKRNEISLRGLDPAAGDL